MNFNDLQNLYTANRDRLSATKNYLNRVRVTSTNFVSSAIKGYSEERKADLILIPNNFEGEIVDNRNNWAFAKGFSIDSKDEKDDEFLKDFATNKDLNVIAKKTGWNTLATGQSIITCYSDKDNEVNFYVPKPEMCIYLEDNYGNVSQFAFFYFKQEIDGYRLYCDAFDDNEITFFQSTTTQTNNTLETLPNMSVIDVKPHYFSQAPAIVLDMEYPAFFQVLPLIDAYNKLLTETNDQFSAFKAVILALKNLLMTDDANEAITGDDEAKSKQAYDKVQKLSVLFLGEDGEANYLKREVQVDAFSTLEKVLSNNIDRFSGNVNYADPEVLGKATNLTVNARMKQVGNKAQDLTDLFQMQFRKLLKIINDFWKVQGKGIDLTQIYFSFRYDRPVDKPLEAQLVQSLINAGVQPKDAYREYSSFSNPEEVAKATEEALGGMNDTENY